MLVVVLLSADCTLEVASFGLDVPVLGVRMRDGLGICDFFLIDWVLECWFW